jgi:tetratricopeptide (TPR) repeat protein
MENGSKPDGERTSQPRIFASLDRWQRYVVALAALLTVVAQLWSIVENRWQLALATLILVAFVATLYFVSHRFLEKHPISVEAFRLTMIGLLIAIPVLALVVLYLYSYLPRQEEAGATTVAVAQFVGPPLPDPYKECRPSDMLVHTLVRVGARFGGINAYEVPYRIDPDSRLANSWAKFYGWFDAADVIVYGEYILSSSANARKNDNPDQIVINPVVAKVPLIPIGYTSAPIYGWNFSGNVARIRDLCGSDLAEAGHPARFLDEARRGAVAIAGLQALGKNDLGTAQDALKEARRVEVTPPETCAGDPTQGASKGSLCPGVLAFYLATLDARLGALQRAAGEYQYAAAQLEAPEPYLDLGELYVRLGKPASAFNAFDAAVNADPNSIAALATRAEYEFDWLRPRQAAIDLQRAIDLEAQLEARIGSGKATPPPGDVYNKIALSRALFQRGGEGSAVCGIALMKNVLYPNGPDAKPNSHVGPEALVEYGIWLKLEKNSGAMAPLEAALQTHPRHVHANYKLGLMLEQSKPPNKIAAAYYLRRAEYAPAISDDDFLYQANAANELASRFDTDPLERSHDINWASRAYGEAMEENPGAVYAYYGRAQLEMRNNPQKALRDFLTAARLHPDDALVQSELGQFLDSIGRRGDGKKYHDKAHFVAHARIPNDERGWSHCNYTKPSLTSGGS